MTSSQGSHIFSFVQTSRLDKDLSHVSTGVWQLPRIPAMLVLQALLAWLPPSCLGRHVHAHATPGPFGEAMDRAWTVKITVHIRSMEQYTRSRSVQTLHHQAHVHQNQKYHSKVHRHLGWWCKRNPIASHQSTTLEGKQENGVLVKMRKMQGMRRVRSVDEYERLGPIDPWTRVFYKPRTMVFLCIGKAITRNNVRPRVMVLDTKGIIT